MIEHSGEITFQRCFQDFHPAPDADMWASVRSHVEATCHQVLYQVIVSRFPTLPSNVLVTSQTVSE